MLRLNYQKAKEQTNGLLSHCFWLFFLFGGAYFMSISEKTPMTVEQAANFTGFSKAYIYKLIGAGKIPSYKPDMSRQGKVILCKEELQNWLFANKRGK